MNNTTGFENFVGQKVLVTETKKTFTFRSLGNQEITEYEIADDDTTISNLEGEIVKSGFRLRVWLPNTVGTMEYRLDRINVHVDKQSDGSFEITKINIG